MTWTRGALALLLAAGCGGDNGGDSDSDGVTASCSDYETRDLADVPSTEWPAGLAETLPSYNDLNGNWSATDCNGNVQEIKITAPPQEEIDIILTGVPSTLACGCINDPLYPDETAMEPVAFVPPFDIFMDAGIDPGVDLRTFTVTGAMFPGGQPVSWRSCGTNTIDPAAGSAFDEATVYFRTMPDGTISMSVRLNELGQATGNNVCELTGWTKLSD